MPTYKISQLTTATAVSATNQFEINQNGASKSVEVSVIDAYIKGTSSLPVVVSVSSASDAVRITQTGAGNALVVQDSANPDSSPFVVNTSGNVGVGTTAPGSELDVKGTLRLSGATSGYVGLAPASVAGSVTYTLPTADGTSGQVLITNASGILSWGTKVGLDDVQTLTNKRITPRIVSITGAAGGSITPTGDTADQYEVTALGAAATFLAPSGTPVDGQKLTLRIKDNGTARALTWTTTSGAYRVIGTTLPTTTVISKTIYVGCIYNSADIFWDVVVVASEV